MKISAFTFIHNGLSGGFPFVEAIEAVRPYVDEIVAVDIASNDGTERILPQVCNQVLSSTWDGRDTTPRAFLKHVECAGDIIIFFEADEVYDDRLLGEILWAIEKGHNNLAVWRVQVEQNFQRIREYPRLVHRVFPKGAGTYHIHPTNLPNDPRYDIYHLPPTAGYLWDCCNNFRDNWLPRKQQQADIWGEPRHLMVAGHFTEPNEISEIEEIDRLQSTHWLSSYTPLAIPAVLRPLLGMTKYTVDL
jgi:hypothetical protein